MSVSKLVVFVSNYPYGEGEPFLEEELKILSGKFDKIYIVKSEEVASNIEIYYVPENAELYTISDKKASSSFFQIFTFLPIYEAFLAVYKRKLRLNVQLFHLLYGYWFKSKRLEKRILQFIDEQQLDLSETSFYTYWCDVTAIALANIAGEGKLNFITRLHGWDLYFERHSTNYLPFREHIFNRAQFLAPISDDGRKYIIDRKMCVRRGKIVTSRLGVGQLNKNIGYSIPEERNHLHILTLSHINPIKSLHRLSDALSRIDDFNVKWTHIGYGDGVFDENYKQSLELLLRPKKNIDYFFKGQLTKDEVLQFLQNEPIDLIVNCSITEGIPVSLMEAMAAGIPAIAINVGGVPEIVENNFNGILLDKDSNDIVGDLTSAIRTFNQLDRKDKNRLSENAVEVWKTKFDSHFNFSNFSRLLKNQVDESQAKVCCRQCLIDNKIYPSIVLDKYGICDICKIITDKNHKLKQQKQSGYLENLLEDIHKNKKGKKYDCIIGISGGVDSSYLACKAKEWGLNPLLVHVDTGWNTELAVDNIKLMIDHLNFDLYTVVIDWNEIKDIVRSFMRASVIDIDWANELSAQASLYKVARKFGIKHILTGHQVATEGWMPLNIVHYKLDLINFKAIHKKFGERKLATYPTIGVSKTYFYEKIIKIKYYNPLDFIPYIKDDVKKMLQEQYGYRDHGHKHYENIFTRFYQGYILPHKFGVDKRIFHFSSLIVDGQMTKAQALEEIKKDPYKDPNQFLSDKEFVVKKLGFTPEEFDEILRAKPKKHTEYPSYLNITDKIRRILALIQNNR